MTERKRWWKDSKYPHIQVPKAIFKGKYENLSAGARILYGMMLDRMRLSDKNGWNDGEGNTYIYFTLDEIMKQLKISRSTANKYKKELVGTGLIRFTQKGKADPHMIYVLPFFDGPENRPAESENNTSRSTENGPREVQNSDPINTDSNNNNFININPSIQGGYEIDKIKEYIRKIIQYDVLTEEKYDMPTIDEYVDIMAEAICSSDKYLRIGKENVPINLVRGVFMKYEMSHIIYVYERMDANLHELWNRRAYLLKTLYKAPSTMRLWYRTHIPRSRIGLCPEHWEASD